MSVQEDIFNMQVQNKFNFGNEGFAYRNDLGFDVARPKQVNRLIEVLKRKKDQTDLREENRRPTPMDLLGDRATELGRNFNTEFDLNSVGVATPMNKRNLALLQRQPLAVQAAYGLRQSTPETAMDKIWEERL